MKFAILGYGFMGGAHLAAMQRIAGVEVTAVATRTRPSAETPTRGNLDLQGIPLPDTVAWVSDWHEVLANQEIDAVDICLPTDLHREVVLAALAAGKHVLCEKPMALNVADCEEMMAAAAKSDRIFMVGQVLRWMYPYQYAAEFVREAGRERVRHATLRRSTGYPRWGGWLADPARSGGAILDLLSHDLDQALSLFGPPERVSAVSMGPVDSMRATLRHADGLQVCVEGGWMPPEEPFSASFTTVTENKALRFHNGVLRREDGSGGETVIEIPQHDSYHDQITYFIQCCRTRSTPELCLPSASADAVRLSLLLTASRDRNGEEVLWKAE